jgi:hypothetical protein
MKATNAVPLKQLLEPVHTSISFLTRWSTNMYLISERVWYPQRINDAVTAVPTPTTVINSQRLKARALSLCRYHIGSSLSSCLRSIDSRITM